MANYLHMANVPELDKSYVNVADFSSEGVKQTWFINRRRGILTVNSFIADMFRTEFTLPLGLDDVQYRDCNYCFFQTETGKWAYYFIDTWEYLTSSSCKIHVSLDVWTTYCLDFTLQHSFVDRCHVDRFTSSGLPTQELVDEGFNTSNHIEVNKTKICEYVNSFIMTATEPLGYMPPATGGGGDITTTNGLITKQGFRFIKGYEAFTPEGLYLSGESFRTVGYGSTEKYNLEYYEKHKPFPCTEKLASEIYAERIEAEFGDRIYIKLRDLGLLDKIKHNMFDAMCSLAYNRGINGFLNDETSPFQLIIKNPTDFENIRKRWEKYAVTSNGNTLSGLVARRKAEMDIYEFAKYENRSIGIYKNNGAGAGILSGTVTDNNGNGYIPDYLPDLNTVDNSKVIIDEDGNTWLKPTTGTVTAGYPNYPDGSFHGGIDYANSLDTPIIASGDGVVYSKQTYNGNQHSMPYGNLIVLEQEGNKTKQTYRVYYAHLNKFADGIEEGGRVTKGQVIGYMGTTGNSTGSHLHYEMRKHPYAPQVDTVINPATNE